MRKKLIYLSSFVFMMAVVADASADLVGYWKLDENSGTTAADSSGFGNHGTISGATWTRGKLGSALDFDGIDDDVDCGNDQSLNITGEITIAVWIKPTVAGEGGSNVGPVCKAEAGGSWSWQLRYNAPGGGNYMGFQFRGDPEGSTWVSVGQNLLPGVWYHIAGTFDGANIRCYLNGVETATNKISAIRGGNDRFFIGQDGWDNIFNGVVDEVRIYNHPLTQEEIPEVMIGIPPALASNPSPADAATDVPREVVLGWKPGEYAPPVNGHKVYLSENFSDVNDGIGGIAQDANSYAPPQRLELGTTYYWRVDEVNGPPDYTVHEGIVWSFTTEPVGYPIENIIATASSAHAADMGPEKTIDGSGLDENDLHSMEETAMWLSSAEPLGALLEYEFDKVYKLHEMWVWNSNQAVEPLLGFGLKDVTIEYSTNGTDYATLGTTHEFAQALGTAGYAHNTTIDFGGVGAKCVRLTANSNWGGILPQYGLSEVRFFYIPVQAREPRPADGETDVSIGTIDKPTDVTLGFKAGREAATHNVYLSTDEQAVVDGTADVTTLTETGYGPLPLDLGQTYYWRVDEVNEAETPATWQGDLWDFTTQEYFILDDIESYNDLDPGDPNSNRIFLTWIDGWEVPTNGSQVGYSEPPFCEQNIVHGGEQSMPLFYDNSGTARYSEATMTLSSGQDWTIRGTEALSLWFIGDPANTAAAIYVALNGSAVVYHDNPNAAQIGAWTEWSIDLKQFSDQGANLTNVNTISIGFGDKNNPQPGGSGKMLFDDIRLYLPR